MSNLAGKSGEVRASSLGRRDFYRPGVEELQKLDFERIRSIVEELSTLSPSHKGSKPVKGIPTKASSLGPEALSILREIALARRSASEKYTMGRALFFTREGLRWATPEAVAKHCALRLKGEHCLDVSCGQGGQTVFLAAECQRVTAFDIDPLNCLITRLNAKAMGLCNVTVKELDCLSSEAIAMAGTCCMVFSDPARPAGSVERTLGELGPDPRDVMEAYEGYADGFCFELPPYIDLSKVDFPHEAEYVSFNGRLNRLNVYTGDLMRSQRSAVVLPSGQSISGMPSLPPADDVLLPFTEPYMHELEHSVLRAGLIGELVRNIGVKVRYLELDDRRAVLLSDRPIASPFFKGCYRVLGFCRDRDTLLGSLKGTMAGKVTLRYRLDPSEYWSERSHLEKELGGDVWVHLFKKDQYIMAKRFGPEPPICSSDAM